MHNLDNKLYVANRQELSSKIKEDEVKSLVSSAVNTDNIDFVDESYQGYEHQLWKKKSEEIKERDNYTCQLCKVFDPSHGEVFVKQGKYNTWHHYNRNARDYEIQVKEFCLTITFHFEMTFDSTYYLAMPRLATHHKVYYRNRNLWEYDNDCLVTLCENCHHYIHSKENIIVPIIEKRGGEEIVLGKTSVKQYNPTLDHTDLRTFQPLALVKELQNDKGLSSQDVIDFNRAKSEGKKWYYYQNTLDKDVVTISYFTIVSPLFNPNHTKEEIANIADFIINDFIENILGFRKKEKE